MSNHFSAGDREHPFQFPGGDARLDLTDLFVFTHGVTAIGPC